MGYKVIKYFHDLQDGNYEYKAGDPFPRKGLEVSEERIAELSGNDNKRGEPLIEEVGLFGGKKKKGEEKPAKK